MPVVVIASPKGGAGKSTTALILGTEMAYAGAKVTLLDCDPNRSLTLWGKRNELPKRIELVSGVSEKEIVRTIQHYDNDGKLVIVDLEGIASRLVSRAITQADLVLTPMKATTLDATIGVRALELIAEEEEALDRKIPHAIVFTMTKGVQSKQAKAIEASLESQEVDIITPSLWDRTAYSALFEFGGDLRTMPPQGNMKTAIENAAAFAQAVYSRLVSEQVEA